MQKTSLARGIEIEAEIRNATEDVIKTDHVMITIDHKRTTIDLVRTVEATPNEIHTIAIEVEKETMDEATENSTGMIQIVPVEIETTETTTAKIVGRNEITERIAEGEAQAMTTTTNDLRLQVESFENGLPSSTRMVLHLCFTLGRVLSTRSRVTFITTPRRSCTLE